MRKQGVGATNTIGIPGAWWMSCVLHNPYEICPACGHRGNYCFEDSPEWPLNWKAAACLERALEWIEANALNGRVFTTTDVWHGSVWHYGMTCRVLKWLTHLGFIERMPGPPQAGNKWRVNGLRHDAVTNCN